MHYRLRSLIEMRIVHFSWEYPPVTYGGLGTHVLELTREQRRAGHDVAVVTQQIDGRVSTDSFDEQGIRVLRVAQSEPRIPFAEEAFDTWVHRFAMDSFAAASASLSNWDPDIVHGHDWIGAEQAFLAARRWRVPEVLTLHATEIGRHNGWLTSKLSKVVNARELVAVEQADAVIVCSTAMTSELVRNLNVDSKKITVIPNGIRAHLVEMQNSRLNNSDGMFNMLFVGRLEWEKGVHHLIDALAVLDDPSVHCHVIGTGSQLSSLNEKAQRKGLTDTLTFHGYLSQEDMQYLIGQSDVAVIPSTYEPFGIVALELGAHGIPLVVSCVGGLRDTVPSSEFGYILSQVTGSAIAAAISEVRSDPSEAQLRTAALKMRIDQEFSWQRVASETSSLYSALSDSIVDRQTDA